MYHPPRNVWISPGESFSKKIPNHGFWCTVTAPENSHRSFGRTMSGISRFFLKLDAFVIKYSRKNDSEYLIEVLKKYYACAVDCKGNLYFRLTLAWDHKKWVVDIYFPGYIQKVLYKFTNPAPKIPQYSLYKEEENKYGARVQHVKEPGMSKLFIPAAINIPQQKWIYPVIWKRGRHNNSWCMDYLRIYTA